MVSLDKTVTEKFPPELRKEIAEHQKNSARNNLFCSKLLKFFICLFVFIFFVSVVLKQQPGDGQ